MNQIESDGSADGTNEKFKIEFATPQTINAIGIMKAITLRKTGNINILTSGGSEVDFSSAIAWSR